MTESSEYSGSTVLNVLCDLTSLTIDQVNFICCQLFALFLSFALKKWVKNPQTKLWYCLVSGMAICYFCFGTQIFHIFISSGISYLVIRSAKSNVMPWIVLVVSMGYLSYLHLRRQFYDYGNYSLDITGPLMVLTQKVTSLAFSVRDGVEQKKSEDYKGTELQKKYAVSETPGMLEFCSFIFQFQSMLAGPLVLYRDFVEFIHTDSVPSSLKVVFAKLGASIFFAIMFIKVGPQFDINLLRDEEFLQNTSIVYKMFYITCATTLERCKYYHAWILADAVCNASGLGFDCVKKTWDLVTNVDAIGFEFGLNLKESLDEWNKGTVKWLRHVVYERCHTSIRTLLTYSASAIWHGYFPGYYLTFLSGALFTSCARMIRKEVRPFFLYNRISKAAYDFLTWLTTRMIISYVTFSFVLLDFIPSILVFARLYFVFHIAAAGTMALLPKVSKRIAKIREHKNNPMVFSVKPPKNTSCTTHLINSNGNEDVNVNASKVEGIEFFQKNSHVSGLLTGFMESQEERWKGWSINTSLNGGGIINLKTG